MILMQARHPDRRQLAVRGFTLIEVMITVAIIAILARIALPAYFDYVKRGKFTEAFNQMSMSAMAYSQYYQDNRLYDATHNTPAGPTTPCPSSSPNFTYACTYNSTYTSYLITATGSSPATNNFVFTLTDLSVRTTTAPSGSGWPSSSVCWIASKSGTCY